MINDFWMRIWILAVGLLGGLLYALKDYDDEDNKNAPKGRKIRRAIYGILSSMFFSYISCELLLHFTNFSFNVIIALCGAVAFVGADTFSTLFVRLLEKKIDKIEK